MQNKTTMAFAFLGVLLIGLTSGYFIFKPTQENQSGQTKEYNSSNCISDDCLMIDNLEYPVGTLSNEARTALLKAIDDEYKAYSTYEVTINKFGMINPFAMIIRAEESHISSLKSLFDKYGLEIPENNWQDKATTGETKQEACQIGVDAEIANAKLYKEELLPAVSEYEDIKNVFTSLMNASEQKHLPAFEKCN